MKTEKDSPKTEPVAAPGDYDFLEEKATRKEKKKGEITRVTRLSLDEVGPS